MYFFDILLGFEVPLWVTLRTRVCSFMTAPVGLTVNTVDDKRPSKQTIIRSNNKPPDATPLLNSQLIRCQDFRESKEQTVGVQANKESYSVKTACRFEAQMSKR